MDLVIAERVALVRGVRGAVLVPQVFLNLGVDCVDGLFFGDFEHAPTSFLGNLLEDFLAVGTLLLWREPAAVPTTVPAHTESAGTGVFFLVGKQDGVDDGVRALSGRDGLRHGLFAAVIHAVRKDNQRFATLLLAHQFIGSQENRVVEQRTAAVRRSTASSSASAAISTATPA